jgi:predicted DNA-binding protein (UPF0251 family)
MNEAIVKKRRSIKMTSEDMASLRAFVKRFETKADAAEAIGISRPTFYGVIARRSCAPETIVKINAAIASQKALS